jgi:hypothetical protein
LAEKNPELASCLLNMEKRALNDWIPLLVLDKGSHSGLTHLMNVGRNVDKMISEGKKQELSAGEVFLLLAAVLLHDIGRILPDKKRRDGERQPLCSLGNLPCGKAENALCLKPQWDHYRKSEAIIFNHRDYLGLSDNMAAKYCALLAYSHGLSKPPRENQERFPLVGPGCPWNEKGRPEFRNTSVEPLGTVRIPLLAALLRIADEAENHWTRALNEIWLQILSGVDVNLETAILDNLDLGKAFRRRVEDVEFSHSGECIVMHLAKQPEPEMWERFAKIAGDITEVLVFWAEELRPLGITFNKVFYEFEGRLHRFDGSACPVRLVNEPMEVMKEDRNLFQDLKNALLRLFQTTMGYGEFTWGAVEAEVGRPLKGRDWWLIERMAEWWPEAISVDTHGKRVVFGKDFSKFSLQESRHS